MTLPDAPAVDYTSRDYLSIRQDLLNLIPQYLPAWTSRSPNDFGIVLLELYSYVSDTLHYYADRIANESYISTATQRASVIRIARMLGYSPSLALAAQATLSFSNSTALAVTVPALTTVATTLDAVNNTQIVFETDSSVTVPANSTATVSAHQGQTVSSESLGTSDGSVSQSYALFNSGVIQGSVQVFVTEGTANQWTYVDRLVTSGPYDNVYTLLIDDNDVVTVQFGDGAAGRIPPSGSPITATYRIGGGQIGNVAAYTLTTITSSVPAGVSVTNGTPATGGADPESTDHIRASAVANISSLNRAVTLKDYAAVAASVPGVDKASAQSTVYTSVNVYVAPQGGGGVDALGNPLAPLQATMKSVSTAMSSAAPAPTTVTVLPPTYVGIDVAVLLHVAPQVSQSDTVTAATAAINNLLSFDNVIFGDQITPGDIHLALATVQGVLWGDLNTLARHGGTGTNTVQLATNEIPTPGTITITATGGLGS